MPDRPSIGHWSARAMRVPRGKEIVRYKSSLALPKPWLSMIGAVDFWETTDDFLDNLCWEACDADAPIPFKVTPAGRALLANG